MKRIRLHKQYTSAPMQHGKQLLFTAAIMLFFWSVFDGLVSYLSPLVMTEHGLSKTGMGVVLGSSSVAGAVFDVLLSKFLTNTHYRRVYLGMFLVSFLQPVLLWQAKTIWIYLAAMAGWGLYYDLLNFGTFDFVSRTSEKSEHSSSFGLLNMTKSLGYLVAPIVAGLVIGERLTAEPFLMMSVFLFIAAFCFGVLMVRSLQHPVEHMHETRHYKPLNALREFRVWRTIGKAIWPVLILILVLNVVDSFFWTLGPLVSEELQLGWLPGSLFITAYSLPSLLVGWFIGSVVKRYGKRRTATICLLLGSLLFLLLGSIGPDVGKVVTVFAGSFLIAMSWPSVSSMVTEYITDSERYEKEIEGIVDFATNIGYVVGPMIAGYLGDTIGNIRAFSVMGIIIACTVAMVYLKTEKNRRFA